MIRALLLASCALGALLVGCSTSCDDVANGYALTMQRTFDVPPSDVSPTGIAVCVDTVCTELPAPSSDGTARDQRGLTTASFTAAAGGKLTVVARTVAFEGRADTSLTVRFRRASTGEIVSATGTVHWTEDAHGCHDHPIATEV
jgi:hypothetical protein